MTANRLAPTDYGPDAGDLIDLALLAVAVAGTVLGTLLGAWWIALVAALPSLGAELVRSERPPRLQRLARRILLDRPGRSLIREAGVLVAVAASLHAESVPALTALLFAIMAMHMALTVYLSFAQRQAEADGARMIWRNLDVGGALEGPGPMADPVQRWLRIDGLRVLTGAEALVLVGAVCVGLSRPVAALALAGVVAVVALAAGVAAWRAWGGAHPVPPRNTDAAVAAAVAALAPEVVYYFSSPASGTYALTVWANVINRQRRPVLVIVRELVHLDQLGAITAPIVVAPTVAVLESIVVDSVRIVLYPTNVVKNNEMVRIAGPLHSFIGHGDSDKVGSFSPLNRMYDEIWVAGEAAIDRYRAVDEGIDLRALRAVGRPQLAEIRRAAAHDDGAARLTVLYAPTWEGFFDEADYSSVAAMGVGIAERVIASGARLLFKPHPLTGHRLKSAGRARAAIEALIVKAGDGSLVVENRPDALYGAFNEADLLITDISSVITDFLASRKPYIVTNRRNTPERDFVSTFPSAGAAMVLGRSLDGLEAALADAAGPDVRRAARTALAARLLGDQADPLEAFLDEEDAFIARAEQRRAGAAR